MILSNCGSRSTRKSRALAWVCTATYSPPPLSDEFVPQVAAYLIAPCYGGRASFTSPQSRSRSYRLECSEYNVKALEPKGCAVFSLLISTAFNSTQLLPCAKFDKRQCLLVLISSLLPPKCMRVLSNGPTNSPGGSTNQVRSSSLNQRSADGPVIYLSVLPCFPFVLVPLGGLYGAQIALVQWSQYRSMSPVPSFTDS